MSRRAQMDFMKSLGIDTKNKTYSDCVETLLHRCADLLHEIEKNNKEKFKDELQRLMEPSN